MAVTKTKCIVFITTLRLLLHIDVIHQASASCPRSWAQAEWIFNHIRDTFPANELQWVGMGLKQCRLLLTKTVSGTCIINHQWSPDIVSILIRCNQTFCVEIYWTESIISSKDLGKWLGMFCLGCRIPDRRWFPRLHVQYVPIKTASWSCPFYSPNPCTYTILSSKSNNHLMPFSFHSNVPLIK